MTAEIKEILINNIKNEIETTKEKDFALCIEQWKQLLDYITNLQQLYENALKVNQNENKYRTELESKYVILQQDLDKANDIIEKDKQFYKCRMDEYVELKKENKKLKECYCNRTDCSGRLKDSKKYDSLLQKYEKLQQENEKLKNFITNLISKLNHCELNGTKKLDIVSDYIKQEYEKALNGSDVNEY